MITFPDGMIGRAWGPVAGRHHDLYLAAQSGLRDLLTTGGLKGFRLFGDKAYLGFYDLIIHPIVAAVRGSLQAKWNTHTSKYRIEVEHNIGNLYDMRIETRRAGPQHPQVRVSRESDCDTLRMRPPFSCWFWWLHETLSCASAICLLCHC